MDVVLLSSNVQVREDEGTTVLQSVVTRLPSVAASHKIGMETPIYTHVLSKQLITQNIVNISKKNHLSEAQEKRVNFTIPKTGTEYSKMYLDPLQAIPITLGENLSSEGNQN